MPLGHPVTERKQIDHWVILATIIFESLRNTQYSR